MTPSINTRPVYSSPAPARAKKAAKQETPTRGGLGDSFQPDWKSQLSDLKTTLVAQEELGISSVVNSKQAGEILERYKSDKTPTEDLKVIADRAVAEEDMLPEFTQEVKTAAAAFTQAAGPDHPSVVDLRHLAFVSVDNGDLNPKTGKLENASKDIDQVEYAEKLPNGDIRMMVGIADVDSLVKKGDVIDNQAMRHGATVYTDDKIFPMIPRNLSEDTTSLNEKVDRLAVIKQFDVTPDGEIKGLKVFRGYVNNKAQMAYDSVNEYLTDGSGARPPQLQDETMAQQMELQSEAAQRIRHHFHAKGSLDLESGEARALISNGKVKGMKREIQSVAKDKVKFNMMAANISSMNVLDAAGMPTLRRIVKTPEKWDQIKELAGKYDYNLPSYPDAKALNEFLESRKQANPGAHEELSSNVVRLVGRGEYVVAKPGEPMEGHFALAAPDYGHTTAPNRRAPDLVNQRIEKAYAEGRDCPYTVEEMEALAEHFNQQEQAIKNIERTVHRSAEAKLMKHKIGQTFDGRIHKELRNGTLVRLQEPYVTGLVQQKLEGDSGDQIRVKLEKVDVEKGHIDFSVAKEQMHDGFLLKH